jgi:hypothetical protein
MAVKDAKPQLIPLNEIIVDKSRNVRDHGEADYDLRPLIEDLAERGQQTTIKLERVEGKLYPITGNRRTLAMQWLAENKNPANNEPYIDPKTGKPFSHIRAEVYENLTDIERMIMLFDHGQTRNLSAHELYTAIKRSWAAGLNDLQVVRLARGLLEIHFPPERSVADNDQARLDYWKGAIQQMRWAYLSPVPLEDAYEKKLCGVQRWPTKKELFEGLKVFEKEQADDTKHLYSRANPGPRFMEWWNEYSTAKQADIDAGNAPKPRSMMNRNEIEEVQKMVNSRILKIAIDFQFRKLPREKLAMFDVGVCKMEKVCLAGEPITAEMVQEFNNLLEVVTGTDAKAETESPEGETPDAEKPENSETK